MCQNGLGTVHVACHVSMHSFALVERLCNSGLSFAGYHVWHFYSRRCKVSNPLDG